MRTVQLVRHGLAAALALSALAAAASGDRIAAPLRERGSVALSGTVHPLTQGRAALGRVPAATVLRDLDLYFAPSAAQQEELDELLRQQQDPASPVYHVWLTPQQYAARFGLGAGDRARVQEWLRGQGFSVAAGGGPNRIRFSGSAAQVEAAFRTELRRYSVGGSEHFANATELSVPAPLAGMVKGVGGLDDFRPRPHLRRLAPAFTSGVSGNHFLAPGDVATIFNITALYNAGFTGLGQKVAVVGQSAINLSDVDAFRSAAGLSDPQVDFVPVSTGGTQTPAPGNEDMVESDIDVEWIGAIARDATVEFVYAPAGSGKDVRDALEYAIENNVAPVISVSYGLCEAQSSSEFSKEEGWLSQAASQGQTVVASSGDAGAADCDGTGNAVAKDGFAVDYPASSPQVTGVGGTGFNEGSDPSVYWSGGEGSPDQISSAKSYIPEVVWNDTGLVIGSSSGGSSSGSSGSSVDGLLASGGGVSTQFTKPVWQVAPGVPADGQRDVPDVALPASPEHDGYLYCTTVQGSSGAPDGGSCAFGFRQTEGGDLTVAGGTSFSAPVFGGIVALIAQQNGTGDRLGLINPRLYQLAGASGVYHDITVGDNAVPTNKNTIIGCAAGVGYDPATGLGSMDANAMSLAWSGASSSSGGASSSGAGNGCFTESTSSGSSSGGGGGGGGAWSPSTLLVLLCLGLFGRRLRMA